MDRTILNCSMCGGAIAHLCTGHCTALSSSATCSTHVHSPETATSWKMHDDALDLLCKPRHPAHHCISQWFPHRWRNHEYSGIFSGSHCEKVQRLREALVTITPLYRSDGPAAGSPLTHPCAATLQSQVGTLYARKGSNRGNAITSSSCIVPQ